jgi:ParB family chromosome partitioning protein
MTLDSVTPSIQLIPTDRIAILNPRSRSAKVFNEIVTSIKRLGLKRPITVTRRSGEEENGYDLVCGQGRLEAYQALGRTEIPALVINASAEDCLVMSLVENCARRSNRPLEFLHSISDLDRRGYDEVEISRKIDLSVDYVRDVLRLLKKGELRLLRAVETGHIPVSVAVQIADADDAGIQHALQQAYEANLLRGRKLFIAKKIVAQRRRRGKAAYVDERPRDAVSPENLVRAYRDDTDRKRLLIRKSEAAHDRLMLVVAALRDLLADEDFVALLRAEQLDSLPRNLADRISNLDKGPDIK